MLHFILKKAEPNSIFSVLLKEIQTFSLLQTNMEEIKKNPKNTQIRNRSLRLKGPDLTDQVVWLERHMMMIITLYQIFSNPVLDYHKKFLKK